jgi:hypothetical protein
VKKVIGLALAAVVGFVVACGIGSTSTTGNSRSTTAATGTSSLDSQAAKPAPVTDIVPNPVPVGEGPKVIRTGRVTLEVPNGKYEDSLDRLNDVMLSLGGFTSGSDGIADKGSLRSGTITFQVPAARFQDALDAARKIGKVQGYVVSSHDVSSQYVDLTARLHNAEATRDAMLRFFADAKTVQDDLAIQNQLAQVTQQIEQLKGQIDYLDHATAFGTVSVSLHEAAASVRPEGDDWGFLSALSKAAHNFVNTVNWLIVGLGSALPLLLLVVPAYLLLRFRRVFTRLFAI